LRGFARRPFLLDHIWIMISGCIKLLVRLG